MKLPLLNRFSHRITGLLRKSHHAGIGALAVLTVIGVILAGTPAHAQTCVNTGAGFTAGPGKDGSPTSPLTGIINTYYPPAADGTLAAGATSITLGTVRSGTSFGNTVTTTAFTAGDLALVIQMMGADFANNAADTYGDNTNANNTTAGGYAAAGNGYTAINQTGRFEFVRVTAVAANVLTISGSGTGGGLVNSYQQTSNNGVIQHRYQIIRVPQYVSAGIGTGLTCADWNGTTGGVVVVDVQNVLSFLSGGTITVAGRGFRAGCGFNFSGNSGSTDYSAGGPGQGPGGKAEGISGFSLNMYEGDGNTSSQGIASVRTDGGGSSYFGSNSSQARGAPGNAGGGGNSPTNDSTNCGGGGGGNGGFGGRGGKPNPVNSVDRQGGVGGAALAIGDTTLGSGSGSTARVRRVFLGGGGGSGSRRRSSGGGSESTGVRGSGGRGGGLVMLHAGAFTGTGTINVNGNNADGTETLSQCNPCTTGGGAGGGGAAGTVVIGATTVSTTATLNLTITGNGGNGGLAGNSTTPFGPGGGGGGGNIFRTTNLVTGGMATISTSLTGGAAGTTTNFGADPDGANYDATGGQPGGIGTYAFTDLPGTPPGAFCIGLTDVRFQSFEAVSYANGEVGLSWNTGFEADNLGFRVWREVNGKRELVTGNGLVAGNALMAGTTLTAGNHYSWRDTAPTGGETVGRGKRAVSRTPMASVRYWLEDVDINGKSRMHGPFAVRATRNPMPESLKNAPLLGRNNPVFGSQTTKSLISSDPSVLAMTIAESSMVQTSAKSATSNAFQQELAAGPAVKLGVRTTGWQSISRSALVGAGLNPGAVDANLRMYVNGTEVPIRVSANSVEFFGVAADTLQSGEQTYWLVEGTSAGLRIPTAPAGAGSRLGSASFASLVERRDRTIYFAALQNGDADNFFGAVVTNSAVDQAMTVRNRDANATTPAQVAVTLQGVSQNDHRVSVKLNGTTLGEVTYNGRGQQTFTASVLQSQLLEGQNTVTLQSADGGDVNLVAAVRISYARSFIADADALSLSSRAGQTLTLRGFSQTPRVFDVTDPANPVEVSVRADGAGTGNVSASFVAPGTTGSTRQLLAATSSRFLTPTVTSNTPSTLSATTNAADFVIITTPDLAPALTPLVQLRQAQGLTVKVVDVTDIYDEFSFGVKSVQAVKDFLNLASHTWQTPVRYAMFAGDASFDPRDFLGFNQDVIPTKLLGLGSLETASDDWFGDFDDSGLSQIAIGRLPGRTQADITAMVAKIVTYDQANGQSWQHDALIVADNNDDGGDFEASADGVEAVLPGSFVKTSVRVGQLGGGTARTQILSALNDGKGLVNYSGHGSVSNWAGENLLTSDDVANLTNTTRPGIVVSMTCLNAFFHDPYSVNLGKTLIRANGKGAAAVWASSSLTISPEQGRVNRALLQALYNGAGPVRLGDAIRQAKASTGDSTIRKSFILLGDPSAFVR